jgi:putative tricarboxylic transport membrane protein
VDLINGFMNAVQINYLFFCFLGCLLGTLVGVLPGISPASVLAILLPVTYYMDATGSIIMLSGIFYGAMYGGSTTSILVNIPGEPASVVTCIDGFQMTRQGRAGQALWISAVASLIGGTVGVIGLSIIGPELAQYALKFGPPEYCGLLIFSLTLIMTFSGTSKLKGFTAGVVGIFLATVGTDSLTGTPRLDFGIIGLMRGIELVPVVVGLFGISEMICAAEEGEAQIYSGKLGKMMPRGADLKIGLLASVRGSVLGFFLGLLPGMIASLTPFFSYDLEKRISRHPEKFGSGVIEGVAGPEATNNATAQAGFIPMMALGIPVGPSLAVLMASLTLHGLQPGPALFTTQKEFAWTVIASMYIGNIMLLILNLPLVGLWARISLIPYKILCPIILGFCVVGAYSPRNTMFDVWVAIACGILGYFMRKKQWPLAPLILGFILGDLFETALRQTISMSGGSIKIIFQRPVLMISIIVTVIMIVVMSKLLRRVPKVESEKQ